MGTYQKLMFNLIEYLQARKEQAASGLVEDLNSKMTYLEKLKQNEYRKLMNPIKNHTNGEY